MYKTTMRYNLDKQLKNIIEWNSYGKVLEIGAENSQYKPFITYSDYFTMDINKANKPDIVSDIHNIKWKSNYFKTVIATEVLEHLINPKKAVSEIYRVLECGGKCIMTTRFLHQYHPNPKDYYRFSKDSLEDIYKKFKEVNIIPHGNRVLLIWHILNRGWLKPLMTPFNRLVANIDFKDDVFPLGFIIIAKK